MNKEMIINMWKLTQFVVNLIGLSAVVNKPLETAITGLLEYSIKAQRII